MSASNCFEPRHPLAKHLLFCAPSPPPAPDYIGAAKEQGQANLEAARLGAKLNNPNVVTPYGTQTVDWGTGFDESGFDTARANYKTALDKYNVEMPQWEARVRNAGGNPLQDIPVFGGLFGHPDDPGPKPVAPTPVDYKTFIQSPDQATITQRLSPAQQAIFDASNTAKQRLSELAARGAGVASDVIGKNLDLSGIPSMPGNAEATRNKVIDAMMSRVNEDTDRQREELNSNLIAAGIRPGTKAYDDRMNLVNREYNDARNQAMLASGQEASRDFGLDEERRKQALTELLAQRQTPLNEITALMSGSQVSNPFAAPGYAQNSQVQPSPIFSAQNALSQYNTDVYNAKAAGAQNMQSGAAAMGTTAIMAAMMM